MSEIIAVNVEDVPVKTRRPRILKIIDPSLFDITIEFTKTQFKKIRAAQKVGRSVSINILLNQVNNGSADAVDVVLEPSEYKRMRVAKRSFRLTLDAERIGGFFPFLIPIFAAIASASAAAIPVVISAAKTAIKAAPRLIKKGLVAGAKAGASVAVGSVVDSITGEPKKITKAMLKDPDSLKMLKKFNPHLTADTLGKGVDSQLLEAQSRLAEHVKHLK